MKVGLYNLEPKIVNTAMMQVSTYHKQQGDQVEIYSPLYHNSYDKVYAFFLFVLEDFGWKKKIQKIFQNVNVAKILIAVIAIIL